VDENGTIVGIDIDRASRVVDLSRLEAVQLPVASVAVVGQ
jgi:uncharacterized protein YuzE